MAESSFSSGNDPQSPTLSARLRELASYLAAPAVGRLTEEQRALALGIARRLVADVAALLDENINATALWQDWLRAGLPGADRLATACFARGEEHRWRDQSARRIPPSPERAAQPLAAQDGAAQGDPIAMGAPLSDVERAFLALRIADRRRFDAHGHPCLAVRDIDADLLRALLHDIAAWQLAQGAIDPKRAATLGDAVKRIPSEQAEARGIDAAARDYLMKLEEQAMLPETAASAIARHDWPTVIALTAAARQSGYADTMLTLITAESAALPSLLAGLRIDRVALAPLEASLATLPARAIPAADDDDVLIQDSGGPS